MTDQTQTTEGKQATSYVCSTRYCQCAAKDAEIAELRAKLAEAREAAAYAYQLAGLVGAGERALDNLSAVAHGEQPPHEWPVARTAVSPLTVEAIDSMVSEFGPPQFLPTEDEEAYYWKFRDTNKYAADSLGELLNAAVRAAAREAADAH